MTSGRLAPPGVVGGSPVAARKSFCAHSIERSMIAPSTFSLAGVIAPMKTALSFATSVGSAISFGHSAVWRTTHRLSLLRQIEGALPFSVVHCALVLHPPAV